MKRIILIAVGVTPETFAARKVRVTGTLDARTKTIKVESIAAAQ